MITLGTDDNVELTDALTDATTNDAATQPVAPTNVAGCHTAMFTPEVIEIMSEALEASVEALPEPVSAEHVHCLAESILLTAKDGERDTAVLERIALVELQLRD